MTMDTVVQLKPEPAEPAKDAFDVQFDNLCVEFNDTIAANKEQLDELSNEAVALIGAFKEQLRAFIAKRDALRDEMRRLTERLQQLRT